MVLEPRWKKRVGTLLSLSIECIASNLGRYGEDLGLVASLPPHIKDVLFRKLTSRPRQWKGLAFNVVLGAVLHSHLRRIDLTSADVDDNTLHLLEKCSNLRELHLRGVGNGAISQQGLEDLLAKTPSLTLLDVSNCNVFNDDVLAFVASHCPKISAIYAEGCDISDTGIIALTKTIKNMGYLIVSNTKVSNKGISALVESNGKQLRELRIDNCCKITDEVLKEIAENCPNMEILTFYNCSTSVEALSLFQPDVGKNMKQLHWTVTW